MERGLHLHCRLLHWNIMDSSLTLLGSCGSNPPMTKEGKETVITRKTAKLHLVQGQKESINHNIISQDCPPGAKLRPYASRKRLFYDIQSPRPPENQFLMMLAALTCASAVSAAEHVYWSYVPHPPVSMFRLDGSSSCLSLLVTLCLWMDLGTVIDLFIHLKKGLHLFFTWDFNHFLSV